MKIKLDKYDVKLANGCPKDGRLILTNICLRNGVLATTDGFILLKREADREGEGDVLLPAQIFKTIKTSEDNQAELESGELINISYKNKMGRPKEYEPTLTFKSATGEYPKYEALFPEDTTKTAQIAVNVGKLKRVLSCMPDEGMLRIGITKPDQPVEFECGNMNRPIRGMLMPMYVDWESFQWYREEKKDDNR